MSTDLRNDPVSRYVQGQMSEDEQAFFEEELLTDSEMQQAVESELILALSSKEALQEVPQSQAEVTTKPPRLRFAIAACLIGALVPSIFLFTRPPSIAGPTLVTIPISSIRSGSNDFSVEVGTDAIVSLQIALPPSNLFSEARIEIDLGAERAMYVLQSSSVDGRKDILVDPKDVSGGTLIVSGFLDNQQWLRAKVSFKGGD